MNVFFLVFQNCVTWTVVQMGCVSVEDVDVRLVGADHFAMIAFVTKGMGKGDGQL